MAASFGSNTTCTSIDSSELEDERPAKKRKKSVTWATTNLVMSKLFLKDEAPSKVRSAPVLGAYMN